MWPCRLRQTLGINIMRIARTTIFIFCCTLFAGCATTPRALFDHPLVGSWTWIRDVNNCQEIYIFRENGSLTTLSGSARFENEYYVHLKPLENGLLQVDAVITDRTDGTHCADGEASPIGLEFTIFIAVSPSNQELLMLYDRDGRDGFGPLTRITP